ncbi:MAG: hypothetical protein NAOJABEB_02281 [Steroidobacteraceae bacterium]|nr:hypothetical protein [Steroidobacteraceae bacterium]
MSRTSVGEDAVAARPVGTVGGVVSAGGGFSWYELPVPQAAMTAKAAANATDSNPCSFVRTILHPRIYFPEPIRL